MLIVDLLNSALVEYLTHHVQTRLKKLRKRQGEKPKRKPGNEVLVPVECLEECLEVCLEWVECLEWVVCLVAWKVCDFSTRHLDFALSPHDYFQVCKE